MEIVFSPHHAGHAGFPDTPGFMETGETPSPYHEIPQRVDVILAALRAAGLGPVVEAEDHGLAPILAVHTAALVELLQAASEASRSAQPAGMPVGRAATSPSAGQGIGRPAGRSAPATTP